MSFSSLACGMLACVASLAIANFASGQTPLHERIDAHIQKRLNGTVAARSGDAEFLRRISLHLTGVIPAADAARAFLADKSPDRRVKLVDQLLSSEAYAVHMANLFDALWMDRRADKHVKRADWHEFLRGSFAANKPYDQLVREILSADGSEPKTRAAARFYLDREGEPNLLTRDISRLFLGMNLHCAQCHDHPVVDAYKQDHYYGVFAFLNRSYVYTDKASKVSVLAEKADGDVTFQSVFVPKVTKDTPPRLPDGKEVKEPKFAKGQEYVKAVKKGERGVPKFSRRAQLPEQIVGTDNPRFARAAVNRVWSLLMGRGIVEPVEYDHPANPPSHPELLQMLTEEFVAGRHDVKALVRAIVLSETYQRSSALPQDKEVDPKTFAAAAVRPLTPEQLAWSLLQATGTLAAERKALGAKATEKTVRAKLAGQATPVVNLFATQPGEPASNQDFEVTLDQTLFLSNGKQLRDWLEPRSGNLIDRLQAQKDTGKVVEELYLSVLTRWPSADERKEVQDYLARRSAGRLAALQEAAWALLTSAEFRFNH